jgi:2-polyprenyl-3-methyl-5-hydroxy-6-metoxy-1,4-benzoquinol methylase
VDDGRDVGRLPAEKAGFEDTPTPQLKWRLLASLLPPEASPVLDCGCGDGALGIYLSTLGWEVKGIEQDSLRAGRAREAGLEIMEGDLTEETTWQAVGNGYGAVIFSDVLEHLETPIAVLRRAQSVLRSGGGVLISIPNVAYWKVRLQLLSGRWQYQDAGILDRTHRWFFTDSTLRVMVREARLNIERWRPLPPWSPGLARWRATTHERLARLRPAVFAMGFLCWLTPE